MRKRASSSTGLRLEPGRSSNSPRSVTPSNPSALHLRPFVARQTPSVARIQIHRQNSRKFTISITYLCSPVQIPRTASRSMRFLSMSSPTVLRKGLSLPGIHPGATHAQLCRFVSRRFRPGPVPQGTQGLQASAKGTPSRVFTRPSTSRLIPTPSLFLINHSGFPNI